MTRDYEYEKNNIAYDWQYPEEDGGGIKCKNFELCNSVLPTWWYDCKANYLCDNCHMLFGTWTNGNDKYTGKGELNFFDAAECPICLEIKRSVDQPNCKHTLCLDCFKRCHYGDDDEDELEFPFPNIEDEYYDDPENPKWQKYKSTIDEYNKKCDEHEILKRHNYNSEEYLRKCPICRK